MCTGAEIAGLALAAGGTVMQQMSAGDAADEQRRIINQAAAETENKNVQKQNLITNHTADVYGADNRDKRYEDAATKNEGSLTDALLSANGGNTGEVTQEAQGSLSNDYTRNKAAATAAASDDILKRIRLMARSNASGLMYNDEQLKGGQLSSDVAGINSDINRTNNAANTALGGVRNNGSLAGGLLTGLAPLATEANFKKLAIPGMMG